MTGSVAATDGGAASVTVTGLNVDLTAPTVTVKGVTSGAKFAGPLTSAITCASTDALSGPAAPCTVAVTKLTGAKTPFWVTTWRYTARGADAAGNTRTVTGTYSTGSIFVAGAAPGLFGSSRVKPGSLVTLKVAIPATKAPRLYVPVKAGATRTAVPTTPSVLLTRAKDGTWVTTIRITKAQAQLSRYWVVGVKLVGETKVRTLLLDTR